MSLIERIEEQLQSRDYRFHDVLQDCKAEIEQLRKDKAEVERLLNELLAGIKGSKT